MTNLNKPGCYACERPRHAGNRTLPLSATFAFTLGLVLALLGPPSVASAATREESAEARQHFQKGQRHYDLHEYSEALAEFKDAYRVIPDPVLLYNIGQCHWKLGQKRDAVGFYRQYLRKRPDAPNHQEVQTRANELEAELALEAEQRSKPASPANKPNPPTPAPQVTKPSPAPVAPVPLPRDPLMAAPASSGEPGLEAAAPPATSEPGPFYTRWWFWTAAAVVVAAGIGVAVASSGGTEVGNCLDLGSNCVRIGQ